MGISSGPHAIAAAIIGSTISSGAVVAIATVITLLLAAATVFGQFRISRNTQTVNNYREAAQAWEAKSDAQAAEIDELKKENAAKDDTIADLTKQVTELRGQMKTLQDMMIGASALEALRVEIVGARDKILDAIGGHA